MDTLKEYRRRARQAIDVLVSLACEGIEVVTKRDAHGDFVSHIHGGELDGETFVAWAGVGVEEAHYRTCVLARLATGRRRRRW